MMEIERVKQNRLQFNAILLVRAIWRIINRDTRYTHSDIKINTNYFGMDLLTIIFITIIITMKK